MVICCLCSLRDTAALVPGTCCSGWVCKRRQRSAIYWWTAPKPLLQLRVGTCWWVCGRILAGDCLYLLLLFQLAFVWLAICALAVCDSDGSYHLRCCRKVELWDAWIRPPSPFYLHSFWKADTRFTVPVMSDVTRANSVIFYFNFSLSFLEIYDSVSTVQCLLYVDSKSSWLALNVTHFISWCWVIIEHVITCVVLSMTLMCCDVSQTMPLIPAGTPSTNRLHCRSAPEPTAACLFSLSSSSSSSNSSSTLCLNKNCADLFLSVLRQISADFNNFWQVDGKMSEILFISHLTWSVLPHFLVKRRSPKFAVNNGYVVGIMGSITRSNDPVQSAGRPTCNLLLSNFWS